MHLVDFANATEQARLTINGWVEDVTRGRIRDLIPLGALDAALTRLVLTNARYFKGSWEEPFESSQTHDEPFKLARGSETDVPMMRQADRFGYSEQGRPTDSGDTVCWRMLHDGGSSPAGS